MLRERRDTCDLPRQLTEEVVNLGWGRPHETPLMGSH